MKKRLFLFTLLPFLVGLVSSQSFGQKVHDQQIDSPIDEVKLYLTAGQMIHHQDIKLVQGRNRLVFSGISAYADPQSIQFTAVGNYRLVSVSTEMDFLAAESFNPRISVLKDSLELLLDRFQTNKDITDSYQAEKAVLNTNRDLGGGNVNLTIANIKEAATYYRNRTLEINQVLSKLRKEDQVLSEQIEATRFQLVELNYNENQRSNQVVVLIDVDAGTNLSSSLKYLVSDCGWAATYDLSAADVNQKVNLKYKAQVYNSTGNAWDNVKLTLSTGDPHLSASHPELTPWYLSFGSLSSLENKKKYYAPKQSQADYRQTAVSNINSANTRAYDNYYIQGQSNSNSFEINDNKVKLQQTQNVGSANVQMRDIDISELTTEFEIATKFSCPSDAKPYMVNVKEVDLDASFSHITVPKLDRAAFLIANIIGWQDLNLIPGPTNVYFGGVYVGVSQIDTRNVSDTLSLSFGRDDQVVVMRKLKTEFSTKRVIGNSKKEAYMYEIAVRNNRSTPISITVYDQVPVSQNSDITIAIDELSSGVHSDETGEVVWRLNINSGDVTGKKLGYTVKYPKNSSVTIQRFRTVSCPAF
ncbi:MAG: hypothetical protein ACI837_000561 [Crocinitomicaceae bacterium]|jgi:uncharacterized protein (TIGR02231 family)